MLRTRLPRRRDCGRETRSSGKRPRGERHNAKSYQAYLASPWVRCLLALFLYIMLALPGVLSDRDSIVALTAMQRAPAQR